MKVDLQCQALQQKQKRQLVSQSVESAFTLIEIVVALSILSVIVAITYSSLTGIIQVKKILDDRRDSEMIANAVLNRMTRELQMAFSGIPLLPRPNEPDKRYSSRINLIGEHKTLSNGEHGDTIRFIALEAGQYLPDGGTHSGLVQIMYRLEEDPENADSDNKRYWLIREETPVLRPVEKAFEKMMVFPVSKYVTSLKFRYYDLDEDEWSDSWGKEPRLKLPAMTEFTVSIISPLGKVETYSTAVPMRTIY